MTVLLRAADAGDAYSLWLWANEPAARAASGNREPIAWDHHLAWLATRLDSSDAAIFIAHSPAGRPLGTIRFETGDGWASARLSYSVAPEARGHGVGRALLALGPEILARTRPTTELVALVRPDNAASRHLFETSGWAEAGATAELIRFVRPSGSRP